jgi:hypothetical protein
MISFVKHYQRVLTPGYALTPEVNAEFFVTERPHPQAIDVDDPWFTYCIHRPGDATAQALEDQPSQDVESLPTGG